MSADNERLRKAAADAIPPTRDRLKEILRYIPETGEFDIFKRKGVAAKRTRGTLNANGSYVIRIDYRLYYAHRIAWLYVTGEWPPDGIDHEDLNAQDNSWTNLRKADQPQNLANTRKREGCTSKYKGVRCAGRCYLSRNF